MTLLTCHKGVSEQFIVDNMQYVESRSPTSVLLFAEYLIAE